MSLEDYLNSLDSSDLDILKSATNNFSDENVIVKDDTKELYKGQLYLESGHSINIVARKFDTRSQLQNLGNEVKMSYKLFKHKNMVSVYKIFCDNDDDKVAFMIYKYEANGSLDRHLSGSTLTWIQRLKICVTVAHALKYLHFDADENHSFIHGNIKSSKILLDHDWEPKLNGFRLAVTAKRHQLHLIINHSGSLEYMDPAYETSGGLTHKSDVFSFGVVLFEVLLGRTASAPISDEDNRSFSQLAKHHYDERTLDDMIDSDLRKQMNLQSLNKFSEVAYYCLKELRPERPDMKQVLKGLETALELQQKHDQSPEHSTVARADASSSDYLKGKDLDHLKIQYNDILSATRNFSTANLIGSGGYGKVYKAELDHFDNNDSLMVEGMNKCDLPKRHSTVAIKHISHRPDKQGEQGFYAEIEMLSNCKHENVVSLLGFCDEGPDQMILVYEHVSNGALDDYLGNHDKMINLTWAKRIQICLDIAHGLRYLHTSTKEKPMIIHRDIKCANILLDESWTAKIGDFGLSMLREANQQGSTLITSKVAGTEVYWDPEYAKTGRLKKESDIYSFGVVLVEIMCGRLAYDNIYYVGNDNGLPSMIRRRFHEGKLEEMVDPRLREGDENIFMQNGGLNQDSFYTFLRIAYQCLEETQVKRPTIEVIIEKLKQALLFQKNNKQDKLHISFKDIKLATKNFSNDKCVGEGRYWKQYEGEIAHGNGCTMVVSKRFDSRYDKGKHQFVTELKALSECKHDNIIGLVGYCNEPDEKIIIYEHSSNGRLDKHLDDVSLTWRKRLKICIDVAMALEFLHVANNGIQGNEMTHRDIKSCSIVLDADWKAKLSNLDLCSVRLDNLDVKPDIDDDAYGSLAYVDPQYTEDPLSPESDLYSLGVVSLEMLCGRLAWGEGCKDVSESLGPWVKRHYSHEEAKFDEIVFKGIKEQIAPRSLDTFKTIVIKCLHEEQYDRPTAAKVVTELNEALQYQEDYEIWEPKLPSDYKEILRLSNMDSMMTQNSAKVIYEIFRKGFPLRDKEVFLSLGSNGGKNYTISVRKFLNKNRLAFDWRHIPQSRFQKVAEMMLRFSDLEIKIKTKTHFLSPGVNYGVHLIFNFCGPRKVSSKSKYVNLTYKLGNETLNAYFATWRDEEWMTIELFQFVHQKDNTNFEVLLERFSPIYCGSGSIYVEGFEFRVIDNVKHEDTVNIKEVDQQSPFDSDKLLKQVDNDDYREKFSHTETDGKHLILSAKEILCDSSNVKLFRHLKPSRESRFQVVNELLRHQVIRIKCKTEGQMLSPDTDYTCYLVFKLSEKCDGLHCPVKVRDLLHWKGKEIRNLYFRAPRPWNLQDDNQLPKQRKDGWMEVLVWKFNSTNQLRNDGIPMHLKLITYEGTMSGLIICGLEIRAM